ncbi:hypothetical protein LCI18_008866 [Fusarium solani-melongenae]|uniref:Uncharacterized protein n=1 Tax=Fusarium solani subsp. cucurbitae TaxID=2747967 RepID=A0ACD3Z9P7_FUSSC|nr:hypothetical protein LCI18_008866 [Fusarium solani-melongenae]
MNGYTTSFRFTGAGCPKTYSSRTEMSAHVQEHYGEFISAAQLGVILDLCNQQVDGMNGEKDECLVCGEKLLFLALQRHLATHMEDMALFVLPNTQEGQDMGGKNASLQAGKLNSNGELGDSKSQASSLGFSAAGDHGQTPADFSKLLTSEEAGYSSKFTHWNVNDDPEAAALQALVQQLEDQDEVVRHAAVESLGSEPALPYEIIDAMGSRLECRGRDGLTVLSWAARNGHEVTFERLIEKGADFESKDEYSGTILHWAAFGGNDAVVRILLEIGAGFDSRDEDGESPLHWAAYSGSEAIVRILLKIGADDQMKNKEGDTPLSLAIGTGNEAIIQLLQHNADSPVSSQSSEVDHSSQHNARDVTPGISLADIDFNSLSPLYKKDGEGWYAIFNPQIQRDLDVDLVHVFKHSSVVTSVRVSHDGMYIATGCNLTAQIFDTKTGERVCTLYHNAPDANEGMFVRSVSFSPDDHCLATGSENSMVCSWDIKSGTILARLEGHKGVIWSIEFSRDGRSIISGGSDMIVRLWDVDTLANTLNLSVESVITSAAFSPDTQLIASGSEDDGITVWEASTGVRLMCLEGPEGHSAAVYSVAFSPDGETLVSCSLDKTIKIWRLDMPVRTQSPWGAKCIRTLQGHKDFVIHVAVTPDGNGLLSGSKDRHLQFWDPKTGIAQFMLYGHENTVLSVDASPKGGIFATASGDMEARVWSYGPYQAEGT